MVTPATGLFKSVAFKAESSFGTTAGATGAQDLRRTQSTLNAEAAFFKSIYDVTPEGNWEGATILNRTRRLGHAITTDDELRLAHARSVLLAARAKRIPPARDGKTLADWNGLAIAALVRAVHLARATLRNIKQNLFWAFCYNAAGIPIAALGLLNPIFASAAMAFSSFSVLANSLRLRRFK